MLLAYAATDIIALFPVTPGGLGIVEASLSGLLILAAVRPGCAVLATLVYRIASYWLPPAGRGAGLPAVPPPLRMASPPPRHAGRERPAGSGRLRGHGKLPHAGTCQACPEWCGLLAEYVWAERSDLRHGRVA